MMKDGHRRLMVFTLHEHLLESLNEKYFEILIRLSFHREKKNKNVKRYLNVSGKDYLSNTVYKNTTMEGIGSISLIIQRG